MRATVDHWIQRYGLQEVRTWYFECWNEVSSPGRMVRISVRRTKADTFKAELERLFQRQQVSVLRSLRVHCQDSETARRGPSCWRTCHEQLRPRYAI